MGTNVLMECSALSSDLKEYFAIRKMVAEGTSLDNHKMSHPRTP
jgi:hypothetical protein